jgi:hypothetical protein
MIENFTPQPYPLEVSHGDTWQLVIGWTRDADGYLTPLVALEIGLTQLATSDGATARRYRVVQNLQTPRIAPSADRSATASASVEKTERVTRPIKVPTSQ